LKRNEKEKGRRLVLVWLLFILKTNNKSMFISSRKEKVQRGFFGWTALREGSSGPQKRGNTKVQGFCYKNF